MAGSLSVRKKNAAAAQKRRFEAKQAERLRANEAATSNTGKLGSGIASIPSRVVNYIKSSSPSSVARDVKGIAKSTYKAAVEDPNAFIEDAIFSPLAAIRDFGDVRETARKLRAQGRDAEAEAMEALAGTAVLSAVPILGKPAGVVTRNAIKAAEKTAVKGATKAAMKVTPKPKASELKVTPKAKPKAAPKPKTAPAPRAAQLEGAETPFMVSTRRPTAPNYATQGNPDEQLLIQTGEALRAAPPAFEKNMNMLAEEPFMRGLAGSNPERIYEEGVRRGADNLKFIMSDLMSPEKVEAARGWYPTANMVSARAAERAGLPPEAGYGVAAVTSPQTPWDINVARVDRMMDMFGDRFEVDPAAARNYIEGRLETKSPGAIAALGPDYAERIAAMPYEELPDKFAKFARVSLADATRNDPMVRKIDLSGEYGDPYGSMTWGSGDSVSKALAIMDDPSMQSINNQLLGGGKVPSFFNNISNPYSASPISTIDTHSAGAASLFPGGGNDPIVYRAMGLGGAKGGPPGAADVARTGSKGLYGPISDMHTLAAKEMGFDTPREVQSATWEGVRDLWGQAGKTPELKKAIADIWNNSSSPDEARYLIAELLGKPVRRMFQVK
jgi:hypothetical protein